MAGETAEFKSNGGTAQGYLALPEAAGNAPGVIVIQEWWGLNEQIKGVADRFAREGFVALAPDLFHGKRTKSPDEAGKLMMALNIAETEKDLRGAIQFLLGHERVAGDKVGTIGFCMGGALSLFAASKNPQVGACVVFYGGHPNVTPDLENLHAPVLGIYAAQDNFVTPDSVEALKSRMTDLGKPFDVHTYNADHAFFNEARPEVYNREAAEDAWRRTVEFFRRKLNEEENTELRTQNGSGGEPLSFLF